MKKFFNNRLTDIKESYNELVHKVSWPTKSELANSTIVVMVASIIASLVIWVIVRSDARTFLLSFTLFTNCHCTSHNYVSR